MSKCHKLNVTCPKELWEHANEVKQPKTSFSDMVTKNLLKKINSGDTKPQEYVRINLTIPEDVYKTAKDEGVSFAQTVNETLEEYIKYIEEVYG